MSAGEKTRPGSPDLSSLQRWMQEVLIKPLGDEGLAPWKQLPETFQQNPVENLIAATDRLSARGHLRIYQSSYILRLRDCMAKQFSALEFALGKELFRHFADQYLQTYPSTSHTLNDLGGRFAQFLSETRPETGALEKETWPDFLIELADFEYAVNIAFDIPARPDDKEVEEATIDTPDELIRLRPVFQIFRHTYPVGAYYRAFFDGQNPELPFPQQTFSVLLRRNYRLGIFDLRQAQFYFLHYLQQSGSVARAKENLVARHGLSANAVAQTWQTWRRPWLEQGFFVVGMG